MVGGGWSSLSFTQRIIIGIFSAVLALVLVAAVALFAVYKKGELSLRAAASSSGPNIKVDEEEVEKAKENLGGVTAIAWQDDWVAHDGKVYEYRDNMLNILVMGIDVDGELSSETELSDWSAGQADAIFVVAINQDDKTISVIGVPRNSMTDIDIYDSNGECIDMIYNQICLQYGYAGGGEFGLEKMTESVSGLLWDLPIHGACAISIGAAGVIADSLGGIEVTVTDETISEEYSDFALGSTVTLTSENVEAYLKYRDLSEIGTPTIRLERQNDFLKVLAVDAMQAINDDVFLIKDVYNAIAPYMNTNISVDSAISLGTQVIGCSLSEDDFYQLTGVDNAVYFTAEDGSEDFWDDYYLDEDELERILIEVFYKEVTVSG